MTRGITALQHQSDSLGPSLFCNRSLYVWTKSNLQGHCVMDLKGDFLLQLKDFSLCFFYLSSAGSECGGDAHTAASPVLCWEQSCS